MADAPKSNRMVTISGIALFVGPLAFVLFFFVGLAVMPTGLDNANRTWQDGLFIRTIAWALAAIAVGAGIVAGLAGRAALKQRDIHGDAAGGGMRLAKFARVAGWIWAAGTLALFGTAILS
jgi:hypothetical protein